MEAHIGQVQPALRLGALSDPLADRREALAPVREAGEGQAAARNKRKPRPDPSPTLSNT